MANLLNFDQAMDGESAPKRHCVNDVRKIDLPEDQAVKSLMQSFQVAESHLASAEASEEMDAAQQELQGVSTQLLELAQLFKTRADQVDAVLAKESVELHLIEALRPGLERLLEARKRLKQIEEQKVALEAVKDEEEKNAAAWANQVKEASHTARQEGCRAETLMHHAKKMAHDKRREEAAERARREAEEKARREAEEKARREAEEKARREAEEKARREAEEKARREAEEKARREAEEKARREAEEKERREAEDKARREAEDKARREAEEKARREAEEKARREAEEKARREAGEKARPEEEKAQHEAEEKASSAEEKAQREEEKQRAENESSHQEKDGSEEKVTATHVAQNGEHKNVSAVGYEKTGLGSTQPAPEQTPKPDSSTQGAGEAQRLFVKSEACSKVTGEYLRIESGWQGRQAFMKQSKEKTERIYLVWSPRQAGHWTFTVDPAGEEVVARSLQVSLTSTPDELMCRSWTTAPWGARGSKMVVYIQRA